jgi:type II secretion system protein G
MRRGFTLIEILVVVAIIGILSSVVLASLYTARIKANDVRRKSDLHQIVTALELYNTKNGSYPTTGATAPNNSATYSTQASGWLSALVADGDLPGAPKDPVNVDKGPWCWSSATGKNTIYTYASDGTHYILCGWMENTSDTQTLQNRDVPNPWNTSQGLKANWGYSAYNIVYAQ